MEDIRIRNKAMMSTAVLLMYGILVFPIVVVGAICGLVSLMAQKVTNTLFDFICDCLDRMIKEE